MSKPGKSGILRVIHATRYSALGIRAAWQNEAAFRQELTLSLILMPIAFWLGQNAIEVILLLSSCLLVIIIELLNSAIEAVVDRIGPEHHELSGRAKDMGSAAVFFGLALVIVVWAGIAAQRFLL